jgi:uncharacterized protein (DUF433 family)/predicted nuclease of predicted toxin-antitoxin system
MGHSYDLYIESFLDLGMAMMVIWAEKKIGNYGGGDYWLR